MLVPSTFTGWYRKMMMNAEIASEMIKSRSQTESIGQARHEAVLAPVAGFGGMRLASSVILCPGSYFIRIVRSVVKVACPMVTVPGPLLPLRDSGYNTSTEDT